MTSKTWTICLFTVDGGRRVDSTVRRLSQLPLFQSGHAELHVLATNWWSNPPGSFRRGIDFLRFHALSLSWRRLGARIKLRFLPDYKSKIRYMSNVATELVMKLDDDIFMTTDSWMSFFDSESRIDWSQSVVYAPTISTGIPGVEDYLSFFVTDELRDELRREFAQTHIPDLWGMDYQPLQGSYSTSAPVEFFSAVSGLESVYRGIHPIRIRADLQKKLAEYAVSHPDSLKPLSPESLAPMTRGTYFCNSIIAVEPSTYQTVIEGMDSGAFFDDGFDEVAFNQFLLSEKRLVTFNQSVAALHPSYNTIGPEHHDIRAFVFDSLGGEP